MNPFLILLIAGAAYVAWKNSKQPAAQVIPAPTTFIPVGMFFSGTPAPMPPGLPIGAPLSTNTLQGNLGPTGSPIITRLVSDAPDVSSSGAVGSASGGGSGGGSGSGGAGSGQTLGGGRGLVDL